MLMVIRLTGFPLMGGCSPRPDQPDLTHSDVRVPDIITIKANCPEKDYSPACDRQLLKGVM